MDESELDQVPGRIKSRVRDNAQSFIGRDVHLTEKYRYGSEISHEPIIGLQKEIDGMARLLCALVIAEEVTGSIDEYLEVYEAEVRRMRELEHQVVEELPERERNE